jgi:hypothetical protein
MNFNNSKKIFKSFKKHPFKTVSIIILMLILLAMIAYVKGFFGEIGKEHVTGVNSDSKGEKIYQFTKGDESPAIVSDGDVRLEYGGER